MVMAPYTLTYQIAGPTVSPGDVVCAGLGAATDPPTALLATTDALAAAGAALGVVVTTQSPGTAEVAVFGLVPAEVTGLGVAPTASPVRVIATATTSRCQRTPLPLPTDYLIGNCDTQGGLTVLPAAPQLEYVIAGDGQRDNTKDFQDAITALFTAGVGGTIRLSRHTRIDFSPQSLSWPAASFPNRLRIEIDGQLDMIGGILEPPANTEIVGLGGGVIASIGLGTGTATITPPPYEPSALVSANASVGAASSISAQGTTRFAYITGIPVTDDDIGQTLTIGNAANSANAGVWTIIGWRSDIPASPPYNFEVRAVNANAVADDPGVNAQQGPTLSWQIGGRTGGGPGGGGASIGQVEPCFYVAGTPALPSNAWKGFLCLKLTNSPDFLDTNHRIVGVLTRSGSRFSDCFCMNHIAVGYGGTTLFPDGNNGQIQSALIMPTIRTGNLGDVLLSNLFVLNSPGIPLLVDNGGAVSLRGLTLSCYPGLNPRPLSSGLVPLVIDSTFEVDISQCVFQVNDDLGHPTAAVPDGVPGNIFPACLWLTQSANSGYTGLINVRGSRFRGAGILWNGLQSSNSAQNILLWVDDFISENSVHSPFIFDWRGGFFSAITLKNITIADAISVEGGFITSPVPSPPNAVRGLTIEHTYGLAGDGQETPLIARNLSTGLVGLSMNTVRIYQTGTTSAFGTIRDYVLTRERTVDLASAGAAASMVGFMGIDAESLPIYDDPFDAVNPWSSLPGSLVTGSTRSPSGLMDAAVLQSPVTAFMTIEQLGPALDGTNFATPLSVGDYLIAGIWAKAMDPTQSAFNASRIALANSPGGTCGIDYRFGSTGLPDGELVIADEMSMRDGGDWRLLCGLGKVTSISPGNIVSGFHYYLTVFANQEIAYWQPFALRIPVAKGYAEQEIIRYYRHVRAFINGAPAGTAALQKSVKLGFGADTNLYRASAGALKTDGTMEADRHVRVHGQRVVWRQQAAIADDDASALATLSAKFNALLDALRTHGLIAGMWTPITSSSPLFYFDTTNVTVAQGAVSTWTDQASGSSFTLSQATPPLRPYYCGADPIFNNAPSLSLKNIKHLFGGTPPFTGTAMTVAAVFMFSQNLATNLPKVILSNGPSSAASWELGTASQGSDQISFCVSGTPLVSSAGGVNDGGAHLVVVTYESASSISLYLDGAPPATTSTPVAIPATTGPLSLGAYVNSSGGFGNPSGAILANEDVRVAMVAGWSRVLTPAEVSYLTTFCRVMYNTPG
jgi:hypothetical protein